MKVISPGSKARFSGISSFVTQPPSLKRKSHETTEFFVPDYQTFEVYLYLRVSFYCFYQRWLRFLIQSRSQAGESKVGRPRSGQ